MKKLHNLFNEGQLKKEVIWLLSEKSIETKEISSKMRKSPIIRHEVFYDISRNSGSHKPDLIICSSNDTPCELKSPAELYTQCRFSHSHLISFLLMVIYGQCMSYADLFRPDFDDQLSICLMVPKVVNPDVVGFDNIEGLFLDVLTADLPIYRKHMELSKIRFSVPNFANQSQSKHYGTIGTEFVILVTLITYELMPGSLV